MRQPSFIGTPLTESPHPAGRFRRAIDTDRLALEQLTEMHQAVLDKLVGLNAIAQACQELLVQPRKRVIWSGSVVLDANGQWSYTAGEGSKSIFVVNFTGNGTVTVSANSARPAAPGPGAGTHNVPAGVAAIFNNETTAWSLYGTAGNVVDVQVFGVPMPPMAAGDI